jgi:hypothetical protein
MAPILNNEIKEVTITTNKNEFSKRSSTAAYLEELLIFVFLRLFFIRSYKELKHKVALEGFNTAS